MNIRELTRDEEFRAAFEVMRELRDEIDEDDYMALLSEMRPRGYRLIAAEEDGRIVALAGIGYGVNFYYRRYIWVYDLARASPSGRWVTASRCSARGDDRS